MPSFDNEDGVTFVNPLEEKGSFPPKGRTSPGDSGTFDNGDEEAAAAGAFEAEKSPRESGTALPPPTIMSTNGQKPFDSDSRMDSEDPVVNHIVPESLETRGKDGNEQIEAWKETLVQHVIQGKENARDKRRKRTSTPHHNSISREIPERVLVLSGREALIDLQETTIIDPNGGFRRHWDFVQIALLVYVAFGVPYRLQVRKQSPPQVDYQRCF